MCVLAALKHLLYRSCCCTPPQRILGRLYSSSPEPAASLASVVAQFQGDALSRVVVMAGAGISTASGIPDFRSPGTGLYDNIQKYNLPYPEAIFDIDYFRRDPRPFFQLGQELYPSGKYRPNLVHYFIRLLYNKGLLLRVYTQNIDGLERLAGIPAEKMVEAHGTFATATCQKCRKPYAGESIKANILAGEIPYCQEISCDGVVKPDIVFFGEMLPKRFDLYLEDMPQADILLIMGTSLEVYPFAGLAEHTLPGVPRILFNREISGTFKYNKQDSDVTVKGDLVETILRLTKSLGWQSELEELQHSCEKHALREP